MKNKNIVYGLLALLGIYLVTKKSDSADSTGGKTSDVGNGSNDVDVSRPTPVERIPAKTPIVDVSSGSSNTVPEPPIPPRDIRTGAAVNRSNTKRTQLMDEVPSFVF